MKDKNWAYIALAVVLGYLTALAVRYAKPEFAQKTTFVGVLGSFLSKSDFWKTYFAGVATYDLAEKAGLSPYKAEKTELGKITNEAYARVEEVEYRENFFKVEFSKFVTIFEGKKGERTLKDKDGNTRTLDIWYNNLDWVLQQPYAENGIYFIQDDKGEIVYIGLVSESKDGFHRILRHFAQDEGKRNKILNHPPYPRDKGYKFRIAQIQNTNNHYRRQLLEEYYQYKYKPRDSYTYKMQHQIAFADEQSPRIVNSILNNNDELAERYGNLEQTTTEAPF